MQDLAVQSRLYSAVLQARCEHLSDTRNLFEILLNQTKSDYSYHFLNNLESYGRPFGVPNQSENGEYNLISV